jgi:outer membrane protein OmpA-like peptidoglycan-associated protein
MNNLFKETDLMVFAIILIIAVLGFSYFYKKMKKMNKYDKQNANIVLFFDFNEHELSEKNKNIINKYCETYGKQYDKISVIGHTDPVGTKKVNTQFGYLRSTAALHYLDRMGVCSKKFNVISKDYSNPIHTTNHALNRRVEIFLR